MNETPPAFDAPPRFFCAACGKPVNAEDCVAFEKSLICAACKPAFFQKLQEGALETSGGDPVSFQRRTLGLLLHAFWCGLLQLLAIWGVAWALDRTELARDLGLNNNGWFFFGASLAIGAAGSLLLLRVMSLRLKCGLRDLPGRLLLPNLLLYSLLVLAGGASCGLAIVSGRAVPLAIVFVIPFFLSLVPLEALTGSFFMLIAIWLWRLIRRPRAGAG